MEITVRHPVVADEDRCVRLLSPVLGEEEARALVASHFREHRIVVASAGEEVVALLAWRTDWFGCSLARLVFVEEAHRRKGVARELFLAVEALSPGPRLFSTAKEDDGPAIRMHGALGFQPSGHIDNLPQGKRELLFFRRIPPRPARPARPAR